jgi:hypothetical protein
MYFGAHTIYILILLNWRSIYQCIEQWPVKNGKTDDFNFPIVNFPLICSNIPAASVYRVYISQLMRYSRVCGSYQDFLDRGLLQTRKLLNQRLRTVKLKSCYSIFSFLCSALYIFVCPFVFFLLAIVLSILLRFTYSDYPFDIFKLLLMPNFKHLQFS